MKISILGCGWFGLPLARHLAARGHQIKGSTTSPAKSPEMRAANILPFVLNIRSIPPQELELHPLFDSEALVITLPPGSAQDYPELIRTLAKIAKIRRIGKIIFTSSTSVYGEADRLIDELSPAAPLTASGKLVLAAENSLRSEAEENSVIMRFGGLVGPGRHPANFLSGRDSIPNGLAPVNLIHLDDCLAISTSIIEGPYQNLTINAVCPHHPTRMSFYASAARLSGKPVPNFIEEKKSWKIVRSIYVPLLLNYEFEVDNWFQWLSRTT